ncbi:MAG: hypothetical protein KF886_19930 [Candidatus Hydrogenedentes bacterium]|nr:hypothetical protein [Candidatus Hydrogenedentota bacterium]
MPKIELNDLNEDITISEDELRHVKGGLLSSYQLTSYKLTSYKLTSPTSLSSLDTSLNYFPKVE